MEQKSRVDIKADDFALISNYIFSSLLP